MASQQVDAACDTKSVEAGKGCWDMARACDISDDRFYQYNGVGRNGVTVDSFCNGLVADQLVCCSGGGLPDPGTPKNSDGTCATVTVKKNEGCWDASKRCKVVSTFPQFQKFEGNDDQTCNNLAEGQELCCGYGNLPDLSPKPSSNGSCYSYRVQKDDTCTSLAAKFHIRPYTKLEDFNQDTFQWIGCGNVQREQTICLSPGKPPLPTINYDAQCGEASNTIIKGTYAVPSNDTNAVRNATCPLKVCCSRWGFCGFGPDFCGFSTTLNSRGKPVRGTGCQSGACGPASGYKSNSGPPSSFFKVGYYESWIKKRPCLNMRASQIDTRNYTHIQFAFGLLDESWKPYIDPKDIDVWNQFKALPNVKHIISFGGWAFSTDSDTQHIITSGVSSQGNRDKFISNVVSFVVDNKLDGVDFDWEYPGAYDIDGVTHTYSDGLNYLAFIKGMRAALPKGYSMSIAAPASYWYLRSFPIEEMAKSLDYIVFMTYDFHGQWDFKINYTGPYLKSHVNWTETIEALTMMTNAGVPSNKILMGLGSYGRSFQQVDPGCSAPSCKFTKNGASPGKCTETRGYLALGEIDDIIAHGTVRSKFYDPLSDSIIMTYNKDDWIAFTDQEIMRKRIGLAKNMNLAGTVEWAIDLQTGTTKNGVPYTPKALAFDINSVPDTTCPPFDVSKMTIEDIVKGADSDDTTDCAMEQMAFKLKDLTKEALTKINRMVYGGPSALNGSVIKDWDFHDWIIAHIDQYFECPGRKTAKAGCNKPLKWTNPEQFYKDIENNYGIQRWWIINGTSQIEGECSDTQPPRCTKPKPYVGNFPVLGPSKVTDSTFSKVFDDIYVPYMFKAYEAKFKDFIFKRTEPGFGKPTNLDRYFTCPDNFEGGCYVAADECAGKCDSGKMEVRDMDKFLEAVGKALNTTVTKDMFEFKEFKETTTICEAVDIPNKPCVKQRVTVIYQNFPYLLKKVVFNPIPLLGDLDKIKDISKYMDDSIPAGIEDPYIVVDTAMYVTIGLLNIVESMQDIMNQAAIIERENESATIDLIFGIMETFFMLGAYSIPVIGPVVGTIWQILPMAIKGEKDPIQWLLASFDIIDGLASMIKIGKGFRGARDKFKFESAADFEKFKSTFDKDPRIKQIETLESKLKHKELLARLEQKRIDQMIKHSHKEKVEEYNKKLSRLSEHHDVPKVGPG
eukprot:gene8938-10481_t